MKKITFIILATVAIACNREPVQRVEVYHTDTTKTALVVLVDSLEIEFPGNVPDSVILQQTRLLLDSMRRRDSISAREKEIADSLSFRKITRIINGGYNGFNHRYKLYENAKKALESYPDTLFK